MHLSAFVRWGAGLWACDGPPEGRRLWRGPVELWQLHLPQPPCPEPLWTVRDASLHLSLAIVHLCYIQCKSWDIISANSPKSTESVYRGLCLSISVQYKCPLPAEEEPLSLSAHLSCSCLLLLCTLTLVSVDNDSFNDRWRFISNILMGHFPLIY